MSRLYPPFLTPEQRAALDATEPAHDRVVYRIGVCACGRRCATVPISPTRDVAIYFPCRERAGWVSRPQLFICRPCRDQRHDGCRGCDCQHRERT